MGWENRGNGRYYYRKVRHGKKVVSEYVGNGPMAEMLAHLDKATEIDQQLKQMEQAEERKAFEVDRGLDIMIDEFGDVVRQMATAVLLTTGHYAHRGQWRKKRDAARA